jgi:hypothetical protein
MGCTLGAVETEHTRRIRAVGGKVRQIIKELGGTIPEELPTIESIKKPNSKASPEAHFLRAKGPASYQPRARP